MNRQRQCVANFERHLNSKQHTQSVEMRKSGEDKPQGAVGQQAQAKHRAAPVQARVNGRGDQLSLSEARNQYLQALEDDTSEKAIRISMLQSRLDAVEQNNNEKLEHLRDRIDEYDQRSTDENRDNER